MQPSDDDDALAEALIDSLPDALSDGLPDWLGDSEPLGLADSLGLAEGLPEGEADAGEELPGL
jgi:hypothetical protein